jgi:hypothetical protein
MGVGGQRHAQAGLPPGKTRYPLYRRLGEPPGRSGRVWKISQDRQAHSESLYWLSYPDLSWANTAYYWMSNVLSFPLAGNKVARSLCWPCNTPYNLKCMQLHLDYPIYLLGWMMNYSQPQFCLYTVSTQRIQSSQCKLCLTDDKATGADAQLHLTWVMYIVKRHMEVIHKTKMPAFAEF